jgi:nicotinamide mononucleotide transporter PnuC
MKFARFFTPFEWLLLTGIIAFNIIYSIANQQIDLIGSTAAIAGVLCVILVAKRNVWNYLFGLVNVSLYAYISYKAAIYGDAALNAFYYLPMQFIGWFMWKRNLQGGEQDIVQSRRMTSQQRIFWLIVCAISVVIGGMVLDEIGDPQPYKDSATTILSVIAQFLMAKAFMEQWVLWILVNVISVAMWIICAIRGEAYAWLMVGMWVFYLMNSINGLVQWNKKTIMDF